MSPLATDDSGSDHGAFVPGGRFLVEGANEGPLANKRFAAKDLIDIAGHKTGSGNPDWLAAAAPAPRHAEVVSRLLDAGATLIGKTLTDELAFSLEGRNDHYGTPVNPRYPDALSGGSSSGSAVAVAAGLCDFALGTDTGGSVRVPAAFCGLAGFRPSSGSIAMDGVTPFAPEYDTVGWFAPEMDTLKAVGEVLLPTRAPPPITSIRLVSDSLDSVDDDVASDMRHAASRFTTDAPVRIFDHVSLEDISSAYQSLQAAGIKSALGDIITRLRPRFGASIAERFSGALSIEDAAVASALQVRDRLRERMAELCPPTTALILPVSPQRRLPRKVVPSSLARFYRIALGLNAIAGHCGMPQLQLPMAADKTDIAPSLIGAPGSDLALLSCASRLPA